MIVSEGRNNMRPIVDASNEDIRAMYTYLQATNPAGFGGGGRGRGGRGGGRGAPLPPGPVVASGGARARPCRRATAGRSIQASADGRQHAVARGCRSREAAHAVSERLTT